MLVRELMTPYPWTVSRDDSLVDAVEIMLRHGVHEVPVSDGTHVEGILTDRDVKTHLGPEYEDVPIEELDRGELDAPVSDFMTPVVFSVTNDTSVAEACLLMAERRIGSLPVLAEDGTLIGILSVTDILRAFAAQLEPAQLEPDDLEE